VDRDEPWTLAVVHDLVPHEGEVWTRVVDELVRRFEAAVSDPDSVPVDAPPLHGRAVITAARSREPVDDELTLIVSRVGEGLGRLHLALADGRGDPAFQPEPLGPLVRRSWQQSLRSRASRTLTQLRRSQPALPDATAALVAGLLEHDATVIDLLTEPTRRELSGLRIRVHGDLDLGRIWWTGRDVVFVDFAGDPLAPIGERRLKRTPLVDVASVLRSLDHAAHAAMLEMHRRGIDVRQHADVLEAATRQLVDQAAAEVLRGYLAAIDGAAFAPADDDELAALLDTALLDQALAEVGAGLSEHADWLIVPLRIVLGLVQAREARSDLG
jgi:maltose alpha-D-glucosyltransferase/alpha-amylase